MRELIDNKGVSHITVNKTEVGHIRRVRRMCRSLSRWGVVGAEEAGKGLDTVAKELGIDGDRNDTGGEDQSGSRAGSD